jgi:hypothetical protein
MRLEFFGIENLNFVEFNITGDDLNCHRLNEESHFLSSEVFNLYVHCFEKSNELYEYFEPTKYNSRKIIVLRNELNLNLQKLSKIKNAEEFIKYIDNIFLGKNFLSELEKADASWKENWKTTLSKLTDTNKEMVKVIDRCIDQGRILWVIGY